MPRLLASMLTLAFTFALHTTPVSAETADAALDAYHETLAKHVDRDGWVDYAALSQDRAGLDAYVKHVGKPGTLSESDDDEQRLATLINAYNAFTLTLILEHFDDGKLKSIKDINNGKPWDLKTWKLNGQTVSLNHIEHEVIRKEFNEPRIHWALVCAAYSCPPLRNEAYTGDKLKSQLASQEDFVLDMNQPRYVQFHSGAVHVTRLFEWYGDDFGDWQRYVRDRLGSKASRFFAFKFLDYDWSLNDVKNKPK